MYPHALALAVLLLGANPNASSVSDQKGIIGTWWVAGVQANGEILSEVQLAGLKNWIFLDEKNLIWTDGKLAPADVPPKYRFHYKLTPSKSPKQINLYFPENLADGPTEGVYLLDGDSLKVCIGKTARPTDLTSKAGSKRILYILTKKKP